MESFLLVESEKIQHQLHWLFSNGLFVPGAEEMAARSVLVCRAVVFLFDGGVPEVFIVDRLSCPCSWFLGAVGRGLPPPETELRRLRLCNNLKASVFWSKTTTRAMQDGGFSEFEVRRLPVRLGALLIQVKKRRCGGGAPAACSVSSLLVRGPAGLVCIFIFVLG